MAEPVTDQPTVTLAAPTLPPGGQWHVLDLFGHARAAGYLTVVEEAGVAVYRLHVPAAPGRQARTVDYHPNAVYSKERVDEETARLAARMYAPPLPVEAWSARRLLGQGAIARDSEGEGTPF